MIWPGSFTSTRSSCADLPCRSAARAVPLAALLLGGCAAFAPIAYYLSPPHVQKAEFKLPPNARLAVLVDAARPEYEHPLFLQGLYSRIRQIFHERQPDVELVRPEELLAVRRENPDFARWDIQRVGRSVKASHVLYLHIDELRLRSVAALPVLEPSVSLHQKLIAVEHPEHDARVWPPEKEGRLISCSRQAVETADQDAEDAEVRKLGIDTAFFVTMPFFDTDLEAPRPVER